ncbi:MAG: hypothetical protein ABSG05_00565 [Candidatus Pacearchaeota archaeon]|jgi:hypothetical protein
MQERDNILRIFQETKVAVERDDSAAIHSLSNQTNNTAALTNDPDNIAAAVVVYALSNIVERKDYYSRAQGWKKFYDSYLLTIDKIIDAIENRDDGAYRENIKVIRGAIEKLSGKLRDYIQDVFRRTSINRASKLYEHGLSMEKTSKLLGVSMFELAEYAGAKQLGDVPQARTMDVRERIKLAVDFFK